MAAGAATTRRRWATRGGASAEALRLAWLRVPVQTLSGRTSSGTSQWRAAYASRRASHGRTHLSRRCAHAHGRAHRRRRCEGRRNHTGGARSRWTSNFRRTSHLRRTSQRRPARALRTSHLRGTWHRHATRWPSRCASDAHARHLRVERRDAAGCLLHGGARLRTSRRLVRLLEPLRCAYNLRRPTHLRKASSRLRCSSHVRRPRAGHHGSWSQMRRSTACEACLFQRG